ncbi:hypothetical protein ACWC10_27700 [Streptomyces sp. NPDC001595]|uniref:hypothetical protein n=1 Tax=Streptomyces sp. NPDC001532 TaxID=3154520 RepID=UPI0033297A5D
MDERDAEVRVEELTRGLRRLAAGLLEAAAEHPDAVRARELSAAARALTGDVLARLDGVAVDGSAAAPAEPEVAEVAEVHDAVPPAKAGAESSCGSALEELVELYVPRRARRLTEDPVMTEPGLRYERWKHLHRVRYGRGTPFEKAPLWTDEVPGRGRRVVRGVHSRAEVLRRLHHTYVTRRDLDGPEGELALRVLAGCGAISRSRAMEDAELIDSSQLASRLEAVKWRALVTAAERGEHARAELRTQLRQLDVLAAAVLELDVAYRRRDSSPALGARIAGAAQGVKAVLRHWPPAIEGAEAEAAAP